MTLFVTDHATLRYLERIYGVDVEAVRREIREDILAAAPAIATLGDQSEYWIDINDMRVRMHGRKVVTIVLPSEAR